MCPLASQPRSIALNSGAMGRGTVMQPGSPEPGHRQTIAMGQHLGEGQRFLTPLYGLRWST